MKIGYARISTVDQDDSLQITALKDAGCERIFTEKASGAKRDRPEMTAAMEFLREGDMLVVWKIDRLARSVSQLADTATELHKRGIHLKIITQDIDTSTAHGLLVFHILGAIAQFERALIVERTTAGLRAAKAKGKLGGRRKALSPDHLTAAKAMMKDPDLTMRSIAERLQVSVPTLYRSFPKGRDGLTEAAPSQV